MKILGETTPPAAGADASVARTKKTCVPNDGGWKGNRGTSRKKKGMGATSVQKSRGASLGSWFRLFACSSMPVIGTIWLFFAAAERGRDPAQRDYARAALKYRLLMQVFALLFLIVAAVIALPHIEAFLNYVQML